MKINDYSDNEKLSMDSSSEGLGEAIQNSIAAFIKWIVKFCQWLETVLADDKKLIKMMKVGLKHDYKIKFPMHIKGYNDLTHIEKACNYFLTGFSHRGIFFNRKVNYNDPNEGYLNDRKDKERKRLRKKYDKILEGHKYVDVDDIVDDRVESRNYGNPLMDRTLDTVDKLYEKIKNEPYDLFERDYRTVLKEYGSTLEHVDEVLEFIAKQKNVILDSVHKKYSAHYINDTMKGLVQLTKLFGKMRSVLRSDIKGIIKLVR